MESWKSPIFIVGNPRSGTTMLRLMLSSHSQIMIAPESGFILWWQDKYGDWSVSDNVDRIDDFINDLFDSRRFEFWNMSKSDLKRFIVLHKPDNYAYLNYLVYRKYAINLGKPEAIWGDKNNHYLGHIEEIKALYPGAKFVHIVRDGRDVATSYIKLAAIKDKVRLAPNLPSNIVTIAEQWSNNVKKIRKSLAGLLKTEYVEVRYEDLVFEADKSLRKLTDFLHLPFEAQMISFNEYNEQKALEPKDYLSWKAETFKKLNGDAVGRYKDQLSQADVASFERIANSELVAYNYIND